MVNFVKDVANTLMATDSQDPPIVSHRKKCDGNNYVIGNGQTNQLYLQNNCGALNCMGNQIAIIQKENNDEQN